MRLRFIGQLVFLISVITAIQSGTIGSQSPVWALVVPTCLGVALGLLLCLGVRGVYHLRAGGPASPKRTLILAAETLAIAAIVVFMFSQLPSNAPAVAGTVAIVVLSAFMQKGAPNLGWDRNPR